MAITAAAVAGSSGAAVAQSTDDAFLNDLTHFLASHDPLAHRLAAEFGPDSNVYAAKAVCAELERGNTARTVFDLMQGFVDPGDPAELQYAVGLYAGSVMNLGTAYYCPQYADGVQRFLSSL